MCWHIIARQVKTLAKQDRDTSQHMMGLAECVDELVQRLPQQQQQQDLCSSQPAWQVSTLQQQQQHDNDISMYFTDGPDAGCSLPSATVVERPSKCSRHRSGSSQLPAMLLPRSWPAEVVSQLEADYLYHVVKQGRQQPSYDAALPEEVVDQVAGLKLTWGREVVVGHNRAIIPPQ
jgi:hypothetical protein